MLRMWEIYKKKSHIKYIKVYGGGRQGRRRMECKEQRETLRTLTNDQFVYPGESETKLDAA